MRITHCLLCSDSNPNYLEFWPIAAKRWLKLGIQPVLFYIPTDKNVRPAQAKGGTVHVFDPIPDIPIIIQTTMLRFWGCQHYLNDTVIISDIDLIPLSTKFFIDDLKEIDEDCYISKPYRAFLPTDLKKRADIDKKGDTSSKILFRDVSIDYYYHLSGSFHIARGDIMNHVLGFSDSWEEDLRNILPHYYKIGLGNVPADDINNLPPGFSPKNGDEIYTSIRVAMAEQGGEKVKRFDSKNKYAFLYSNHFNSETTSFSTHWHSLIPMRPYSQHEETVETILHLHDTFHAEHSRKLKPETD